MTLATTAVATTAAEVNSDLVYDCEEVEGALLKSLLIALNTRDADTYNHTKRTVRISLLLGLGYGLNQKQMRALELGALLHDIGKIGVSDAVLRKPSQLDEE